MDSLTDVNSPNGKNNSFLTYVLLVFYGVALVMNIFGNTLILVAISRVQWLRKKMYATIQALAIADLQLSVHIIMHFIDTFMTFPDIVIRLYALVRVFQFYVSGFHVVLVAVDRLVAIRFPIYYQTQVTIRRIRIMSALMWFVSAVTSMGKIVINFQQEMDLDIGETSIRLTWTIPYFAAVTFLTVTMCYCYGKVSITARRRMKEKISQPEGTAKNRFDRATKMMTVVVGVYVVLLMPFFISAIASLIYRRQVDWVNSLMLIGVLCETFNSSVNIVIYYVFNPKLRAAFRETLKLLQMKVRTHSTLTSGSDNSGSSTTRI